MVTPAFARAMADYNSHMNHEVYAAAIRLDGPAWRLNRVGFRSFISRHDTTTGKSTGLPDLSMIIGLPSQKPRWRPMKIALPLLFRVAMRSSLLSLVKDHRASTMVEEYERNNLHRFHVVACF